MQLHKLGYLYVQIIQISHSETFLAYCQTCVPMSCVSLPLVHIFGVSSSCPHSVLLVPAMFDLIPGVSRFPLVSSVYS